MDNLETTVPSDKPKAGTFSAPVTPVTSPSLPERPPFSVPLEDRQDVAGWPLIARGMAVVPSLEAYGRFRELNVKNLLYYQIELDLLQRRLESEEKRDFRRQDTSTYHKSGARLIQSGEQDGSRHHRQWEIVLNIREVLDKYSKY